jgi:hypothetical protein
MSEPLYYYEKEGVTAGPVPADELSVQGVRRETLVWTATMSNWRAAGQVAELTAFFAAVPPPLPARTGPPPLPVAPPALPALVREAPPVPPATPFAPAGYSLPLLGKFKDDRTVWDMSTQQPFGEFMPNADLHSLQEWGFVSVKKYQFVLLDAAGKPLLTFYKPKAPLLNPLRIGELRVLDARNQLLGTCRYNTLKVLSWLLTVEDAQGHELMLLKSISIGSRDWVLETPTGVVIGRVRRSRSASWTQLLLEQKHDRFELIFEEAVQESHKALGLSAIIAAYLLFPS